MRWRSTYLFVRHEPSTCITAFDVKFSEAAHHGCTRRVQAEGFAMDSVSISISPSNVKQATWVPMDILRHSSHSPSHLSPGREEEEEIGT